MDKFELQQLRDLPIEGVAERLGMEVVRHKALCPFHDDHHASLSFNVRKNTYRCFVCGEHGGTIDLVMKGLRKDFIEACSWLGGEDVMVQSSMFKSSRDGFQDSGFKFQEKTFDAQRYERFFERPWLSPEAQRFLFEERRLDERVVRWCRLTSWRDRQGVNWLQIPYYDREGHLVGIQNRNLDWFKEFKVQGSRDVPRLRFPQGSECGIYNLPILNMLKPSEPLYITEGASDCWAMLSSGHKAIAIPSATLLKPKDVRLLETLNLELGTQFHLAPDRDEPGERLFLQLQNVLPNLEHHQLPLGCKDYAEYYIQVKMSKSQKV